VSFKSHESREARQFRSSLPIIRSLRDWLADDAVCCEPLSAPNSLLNREITGNFLDLDLNHADPASKKPPVRRRFFGRIPYSVEQGILKAEQGIPLVHQGIFRADKELISRLSVVEL
jgi:hypothetical protein